MGKNEVIMILYCDIHTKKMEDSDEWKKCVEYLYVKWIHEKNNRSLFLYNQNPDLKTNQL